MKKVYSLFLLLSLGSINWGKAANKQYPTIDVQDIEQKEAKKRGLSLDRLRALINKIFKWDKQKKDPVFKRGADGKIIVPQDYDSPLLKQKGTSANDRYELPSPEEVKKRHEERERIAEEKRIKKYEEEKASKKETKKKKSLLSRMPKSKKSSSQSLVISKPTFVRMGEETDANKIDDRRKDRLKGFQGNDKLGAVKKLQREIIAEDQKLIDTNKKSRDSKKKSGFFRRRR